jgi:hypothetical protein
MFRIGFDSKTGMFVVQVLIFGLFWRTVQARVTDAEVGRPDTVERCFKTYAEARKWVEAIGLSDALREHGKLSTTKTFNLVEIQS